MNGVKPISVLVFGAGAIGTYVGGSLALAGHRVVFIEQPSVAAELQGRGLRLDVSIDRHRQAPEPINRSSKFFWVCLLARGGDASRVHSMLPSLP